MLDKSELGKRIKKVREHRHLTLKNIEAVAGISATHISEIERGKTSPTLGALLRISRALGKDPAYFVEEKDLTETSIVTLESREEESINGGVGTMERLTSFIPGGRLQCCLIRLGAGKSRHEKAHSHAGNEAVLVLSGSVQFRIGKEEHELGEGDSIYYDAVEPHVFVNPSPSNAASLVWVCSERNAT